MSPTPTVLRKEKRRFELGGSSFLEVTFYPSREGRQIEFRTNLPTPLQAEEEISKRCLRIAEAIRATGRVPLKLQPWLADTLEKLYFNLAFTSSPNWDLRSAIGVRQSKGRPTTATARDFYLALYVKFHRSIGITQEESIAEAANEFALSEHATERALKTWGRVAGQVMTQLIQRDERLGFARGGAIKDYLIGLHRSISLCILKGKFLPGVEAA